MLGFREHERDLRMSSEIAIKVENLSKCYQIYDKPRDRLMQSFYPRLQRLIGKKPKQYYRDFWALKNISFELKKRENIGIIGRNGSGKSTLLQLICGTLNPTSGSIQINGRIAALLELGSGFNPEFTGRENVYMNASVLGLSNEEIDARFDDIVAFADIGDFVEQPVKTYSSGMMVRLAFSVIAHVDADILVIDEALSVGDAFFTQKCMRFLRSFMQSGTILFVSHDIGAVVNLCSKSIFLHHGEIADIGTSKDVTERYLATLYESNQKIDGVQIDRNKSALSPSESPADYCDVRQMLINSSNLRNDIEIFKFNPNQDGFGTGMAKIVSVRLLDIKGSPLAWIVGGEHTILDIQCLALADIDSPIVGFDFKDRLGQVIFGDNTYLTYQHNPIPVKSGRHLNARFEFRMPVLPSGDYAITVAIADGSQSNHVQHHWMHDALLVRAHASSVCFGLIGIPMKNIKLVSYDE